MSTERPDATTSPPASVKLPYSPPVILSREPLEAVAAVCTGGGPASGKTIRGICAALRS